MFGKNYKTSMAGVGMILTAIAQIVSGLTDVSMINWGVIIASIIAGIGLLVAKDGNVTGGTVAQPSSTQALVDKAKETRTHEAQAALAGDASATAAPIVKP